MKRRGILTSYRRLRIGRLIRKSADLEVVLETISAASKDGTLVELALSSVVSEAVTKWPLLKHPDEWRKFFNDMPDAIQPDSFDLHVVMRHIGPARTKARTREQKLRVIRECDAPYIEYDDIVIGIELAQEIGASDWFRRLHERAGDRATTKDRHRVAEPHYEKAHAVEKRSRSFEHQGRYWDALEYATYKDSSRVLDLINRCIKSVDVEVGWNNHGPELKRLDVLRERALSAPDQTPFAIVIQHLEDKRKELIEAVNTSFINRMNESTSESDKAATRSQWSLFYEAVGHLVDAADKSKECGDLERAAELYRRAGHFGSAIDLVSTLRAKAILQEQAGDLLGAAETYEEDGALKEAIDLYRRAKRFDKFLDLSLSSRDIVDLVNDGNFVDLMTQQHRDRQLVDLAIRTHSSLEFDSPTFIHLERALELGNVDADQIDAARSAVAHVNDRYKKAIEPQLRKLVHDVCLDVDARYSKVWGLDLGTTNSVVAIYNKDVQEVEICRDMEGREQFRSTLALDSAGREFIGLELNEAVAKGMTGLIWASKRKIGTKYVHKISGHTFRPEEVAARVIGQGEEVVENYLKGIVASEVEAEAKTKFGRIPPGWLSAQLDEVSDRLARGVAIVTIPAYFMDASKAATRKACDIAKVELRRLLHEPTAACIGLSKSKLMEQGDAESCICVVDIGAGTTDLSVLDVSCVDSVLLFEVFDTSGDPRLGGNDFDEAIFKYLVEYMERKHGIMVKSASENARRLRVAAERLKIDLSHSNSANYVLHGIDGQDVDLAMSKADLSEVLAVQLGRLHAVCKDVRHRLQADTYQLLLVGGSTLMPCVQEVVKRVFNVEQITGVDPRFAVARGAARQGAILAGDVDDELVYDITPLSLGIKAGKDGVAEEFFDALIEERTNIPTREKRVYTTAEDDQDAVDIFIYQAALAPDSYVGHLKLDVLPAKKGVPQIEVAFAIDADCVLTVSATDLRTRKTVEAKFKDTTLLSPGEIGKARARRDESMERSKRLENWEGLVEDIKDKLGEGRGLALKLKEKAERWKQYADDFRSPQAGTLDAETEEKLQFMFKNQFALYNECLERLNSWADLQSNAEPLLSVESDSIDAVGLEQRIRSAADILPRLAEERKVMRGLVGVLDAHLKTLQGAGEKSGDPAVLIKTHYDRRDHTKVIGAFEKTLEQGSVAKLDDGHVQKYLDSVAEVEGPRYYNDAFRGLHRVGKVNAEPIEDWNALDEWIERVKHSVAFIRARTAESIGYGSGFLVGANLVATNKHVTVHGEPLTASSLDVFVGGDWRKVRLVRRAESDDDVAVLVLTNDIRCARPFTLGRSKVVGTASNVVVAGFPNPSLRGSVLDDFKVEDHLKVLGPGIIQGRRRDLPVGDEVFQIGIPLYGGISGAPLINGNGEVIGLTTSGRSIGEGGAGGIEYFAVFADWIRPLMASA